jgi:hypothetical protein
MLETLDGAGLIARLWTATKAQAALTSAPDEFFAPAGPVARQFVTRRSYHRFYYRRQAILSIGKTLLGVYTTDVSQLGIGLVTPEQLFPLDRATLLIPGPKKTAIEISCCHRLESGCYLCGAKFIDASTGAPTHDAFPEIAHQLVLG